MFIISNLLMKQLLYILSICQLFEVQYWYKWEWRFVFKQVVNINNNQYLYVTNMNNKFVIIEEHNYVNWNIKIFE